MAFRSVATALSNSTDTVTVTKPSGVVDNDILVAEVTSSGGTAITAPGGWAQWGTEQTLGAARFAVFWKRALSEGANYVFTSTGAPSGSMAATMVAFLGIVTSGDPQDGLTLLVSASNTTHTVTGFTTTTTDDLLALSASMVAVCTFTAPGSMVEQSDANNAESATQAIIVQGATGNKVVTTSATTQLGMCLVAMKLGDAQVLTGNWRIQ